jgi:predicted transcriptional regulator
MRVNRKIVEAYTNLQKQLPSVIDGFGLQHKRIYEEAGIPKVSYFRKLKTGTFTPEELTRIIDAINR